ncbi:MAG TPA: KGG domain-containing protein [Thermoanaerobaculia bacterium]|nr:KGG domain-containing protein [Thermoanaerobaculia bacterium]
MAQTSSRGFASMDREKQREIARKGGKAAHAKGTAHEFTTDEARAAGRKGGQAVSQNRAHMAEIGRRGGERRGAKRAASRGNGSGITDSQTQQKRVDETPTRPASTERSSMDRNDRSVDANRGHEYRPS